MADTDETKVVLITGGTSGLGFEAAQQIARLGHRVVIHGRNEQRGQQAVERLREISGNSDVHLLVADYGSLASVRSATETFRERFGRLDVLINNVAMSQWGQDTRRETADGHEFLFTTNYLSHYLLTRMLLDLLVASAPARIVSVGAMQMSAKFDFDDLQLEQGWTGFRAILQSKLGMFCMTRALAEKLRPMGVTANILDPGLVNTGYQAGSAWYFKVFLGLLGKPAAKVAETYTRLATSPEVAEVSGVLFSGRKRVPFKGQAADDAIVQRIWDESARLVDVPPALDLAA